MRVILDTNILLSALLSPLGAPASFSTPGSGKCSRSLRVMRSLRNSATLPAGRFSGQDSAPARSNCSPAGLQNFSLYCKNVPPASGARPKGQLSARSG